MIISPKQIIADKIIQKFPLWGKHLQMHWIDLTIKSIEELDQRTSNAIMMNQKQHCKRIEVESKSNCYMLPRWHYDIVFEQTINIPNWMAATLHTRSTINRWGNFATSWLYDAGYHWIIGCILHVNIPLAIEKNVPLVQIVFHRSEESDNLYNWAYNAIKQH